MRHPWSIARRIVTIFVLLVSVIALFSVWVAYVQARDVVLSVERHHVAGVTALVAEEPEVLDALRSPEGAAALQESVDHWTQVSGVSWMSVLDTSGMRVVSWRPDQVGVRYPASVERAVAGESWTEVSTTGSAGRSVRALAPVVDPSTDEVAGVVTMGVPVDELGILAQAQLPRIVLTFALTGLAGVLVAGFVARYLHRVTLGRGPEEIAEQFLLAEMTMDALDVGIVVLAPDGRVRLANDAAVRLLALSGGAGATLPEPVARAVAGAEPDGVTVAVADQMVVIQRHRAAPAMSASRRAAAAEGVRPAPGGAVVLTVHDQTDLRRLGDELTVAHTLTSALRAQTHEHANQLHTALSLVESGRLDAAKAVLSRHERPGQDSGDVVKALLTAKAAEARERGVSLHHRLDLGLPSPLDPLDLIAVLGNLVDNALDAAGDPRLDADARWVEVDVAVDAAGLVVQVADGGPGPGPTTLERMFDPGWSTKPAGAAGRGVGLWLVRRIAERAGGSVEVVTDSGTVFTLEVPPARHAVLEEETSHD